jgi:hypothetical protein
MRALSDAGHYYVGSFSHPQVGPKEPWRLVARELERRRREEASNRPTYSVQLRARERLAIRPGPTQGQLCVDALLVGFRDSLNNDGW